MWVLDFVNVRFFICLYYYQSNCQVTLYIRLGMVLDYGEEVHRSVKDSHSRQGEFQNRVSDTITHVTLFITSSVIQHTCIGMTKFEVPS